MRPKTSPSWCSAPAGVSRRRSWPTPCWSGGRSAPWSGWRSIPAAATRSVSSSPPGPCPCWGTANTAAGSGAVPLPSGPAAWPFPIRPQKSLCPLPPFPRQPIPGTVFPAFPGATPLWNRNKKQNTGNNISTRTFRVLIFMFCSYLLLYLLIFVRYLIYKMKRDKESFIRIKE